MAGSPTSPLYVLLQTPRRDDVEPELDDEPELVYSSPGWGAYCCPLRRWMVARRVAEPPEDPPSDEEMTPAAPEPTPIRRRPHFKTEPTPLIVDDLEAVLGTGVRGRGNIELATMDDNDFLDTFFPIYPRTPARTR